ncbi:hypothetical protein C7S17_2652 [Burkholderia thailandensis]|nr:hypothetical protein [Burkholderia thailandensis]
MFESRVGRVAARDACRRFARGDASVHAAPKRAVACPRAGRIGCGRVSSMRCAGRRIGEPRKRALRPNADAGNYSDAAAWRRAPRATARRSARAYVRAFS